MKNRPLSIKTSFIMKILATTSLVVLGLPVFANPQGGVFVAGNGSITEVGKTVTIDQDTHNAVAKWDSFNINIDEHVNIHQPSSSSTLVNMIESSTPSFIFGQLNANGNIVLTNPNGVMFGRTSRVDVNSLVASTSTLKNPNQFMKDGLVHLDQSINSEGVILNHGLITASDAGLVSFISPHVENHGIIMARLGRVHLASGDIATVDFFGDGLIEVAVSDAVTSQSIINTGNIYAQGGVIALTAAASKKIIDSLIVVSGELHAPSFKQEQGKIVIYGEGSNAVPDNNADHKNKTQGASTVIVDGVINASGNNDGEVGGDIKTLSDQIAVLKGAVIDTSGDQGGGTINIGGDYLGTGKTPTAKATYIEKETIIASDAHTFGDGGRVIVWADETTLFEGNIFARGGVHGGNGGFTETSGKQNLKANGFVDLRARHASGNKGTYLLDPADITIHGDFHPHDIAGNVLWLDSSDTETVIDSNGNTASDDGFNGSVATWVDKSGNGNDVSNAVLDLQPTYDNEGQNGQGVIHFDKTQSLYAQDSDVPTLDFSGNELSYFGVLNPEVTSSTYTIFNKEDSYQVAIQRGLLRGSVQTEDPGSWFWGGSTTVNNQWQQLGFQHANTAWNFFQNGQLTESITPANNEIGNIEPTDDIFTIGGRGQTSPDNSFYFGDMAEVLIFDRVIDTSSKNLLDQYQSAKWDIPITPPGTGDSEINRATASDGYSNFAAQYLERLSETADIHLQASNSITLDLKGYGMTLGQDKSISLTTDTGDITSISGGSITTNRQDIGGNVTILAGGAGNIDISDLSFYTQNGGQVNLTVDTGTIAYHQNYVEPVMTLPETVDIRSPAKTINTAPPIYTSQTTGLETLISFADTSEEEIE